MEEKPDGSSKTCLPKKYPRRPGSDDSGRDYEVKITALLALRCVTMKDTEDMWLGSNVDQVGDFDDVVLIRRTSEGNSAAYMIQLKHQESPKSINPDDFTYAVNKTGKRKKSKEDFSLSKYSVGFRDLKKRLSEPQENEADIIRYLRKTDAIVFVLFTNKGLSQCDFLDCVCDDSLCFLNTCYNNKDNIYKFNGSKLDYDQAFLQQLVLFCNQLHINDIDGLIENEVKRIMGSANLTNADLKCIGDRFIAFVRIWAKGAGMDSSKLCLALTKSDIINIISDILLDPYKLDIAKDPYEFYDDPHRTIWNRILHDKAVTIIDAEDSVLTFLKQYVGTELRRYCSESGKTWAYSLTKGAQNLFYKEHGSLNAELLKIVSSRGKITLYDIYKCLWFANKIPLILRIHHTQDYQNIARILKLLTYNLPVVVIKDETVELVVKKESAVKYFININDLGIEDRGAILNHSAKLQGRSSLLLQSVVDERMYQHIKCKDITKILSNDFSIGAAYEPLPEYFIQRSLSKILLRKEVLQHVDGEIFVVENVPDNRSKDFINANCHIANEMLQQMEKLKGESRAIHRLSLHNEDNLEWKQSNGGIHNIRRYKSEHQVWGQLHDVIKDNNSVHLISAGPGMGKSTFMDFIANQTPADTWVLKINLNDHDDYYESGKLRNAKACDHLKYFNSTILDKDRNGKLSMAVFQKLIDRKRVLVLLDGFDEISVMYKEEVIDIVKCLYADGFAMWLTTRPVMESRLEEVFETMAMALKPFTTDDQKNFLAKYFSHGNADADAYKIIEGFVQKLLRAARVNLNDRDSQFTGIPLQTKLLADVFVNECKTSVTRGIIELREKFDLLYLYDRFIKNKTDIVCSKFGKGVKHMRVLFQKHHQLFALKILFRKSELAELKIDKELDEYYEDKECKIQFLQREGVVVVHRNSNVTKHQFYVRFAHRTFAEYMAAQWLAQNVNNATVNKTVTLLTTRRFPPFKLHSFLYDMFDRIVAADYPLHSAILNERLDEIEQNMDTCVNTVDGAGRTVLHLMALHGLYHPYQALFNNLSDTKDKMVDILNQIPDDSEISNITDNVLRWNALDYAVTNYSLAIANRMCEKFSTVTLGIDLNPSTQEQYLTYCAWLNYEALAKVLLPHFGAKILVLPFAAKVMDVQLLYESHFTGKNEFVTTIISELASDQHCYGDLHFAAAFGTKENVNHLLNKGANINQRDFQMNTPLHYTAIRKRPDIASLLIAQGAKIEKWGKNLNTALHYAAESGANDIISELIDKGANINCQNTNDDTPLHFAFLGNHIDTVKLLLSKGGNGSIMNLNGDSILHNAAEYGYDDIIMELIRNGEDINKVNSLYETALHLAIKECHSDTVKLLLSEGATLESSEEGDSVLHYAAMAGDNDMIAELLSRGADIDVPNCDGEPPLHFALRRRRPTAAEFLLSKGAATDRISKKGVSTLHYAAESGADDIVLELLSKGADINKVDDHGDTPLHFALKQNRSSTATLLLSKGAEGVAENHDGKSTLHYAAELGDGDIVTTLLSRGAEIDKLDDDGDTPLHVAAKRHLATTELLIRERTINKQNKYGDTPLHSSIADPSQYDKEGFKSQELVVRLLLDKGADINVQDFAGNTPLHHACEDHFKEIMITMINIENKRNKIDFYEKVVALLLSRGAKTNIKNKDEKMPLDLAMEAQYTNIVDLLQQNTTD